ncbi:GAF and ANTAR domain-containing protein [Iamia majanohamensis]|uniref:GAF and ANTAR domain-containing protein n=1 Tax=Iamia majanohamensis TaxID=467976 RepID=A0AAE9Y7P7_9ACTN|nr:GAF and ANTAR domain-containing protein [Iamia majanohamensis]WCO68250.1 GAF and ANTAR domain-containing protein [Iamia majanohamensis]
MLAEVDDTGAQDRTDPASDPSGLADAFAQVARSLVAEDDLPAVLSRISTLAVQTIDGAEHCGITLVSAGVVRTAGSSDEVPERVDRLQYETGEGPCLSAIREHQVFRSDDIRDEDRWPSFVRRAEEETGVRSILSFRLFIGEDTLGALNLYAGSPGSFGEDDVHVGAVFAAHAAVAMESAGQVDDLRTALRTRDVIATAKGIIMAESDLDDDQAFDVLRRASQRTNVKLREVAAEVVDRHSSTGTAAEPEVP